MKYHFITVQKRKGLGFDQVEFIKCSHFTSSTVDMTITYKDDRGVWKRYHLEFGDTFSVVTRNDYWTD